MDIRTRLPCQLTVEGIVGRFECRVKRRLPRWRTRLAKAPERLGEVEQDILAFSRDFAGLLTAAALDAPEVSASVAARAEALRKDAPGGQHKRYCRERKITFLCGLVLTVACWYCAPRSKRKKRGATRGVGRRGKDRVGLYPEWAALGIREGASPELQSEAGRMMVLMPSIEAAREELSRRGVTLDEKTERRLGLELGFQALAHRKDELERWRRGELPAGHELHGKRVAVATDGGRTRMRVYKKGKKTRKRRKRFTTPWREPKLLVIYVLDKQGKRDRKIRPFVDSTLLGPDHLMELAAYHLHRLGAAEAKAVIFLGDGADWIWDRVPRVIEQAGLKKERCYQAVDLYHAMEHVSAALAACAEWTEKERRKQRTRLKTLLKAGKVEEVIAYLKTLKQGRRAPAIQDEIKYLQKRTQLMQYGKLRSKRLPIGSGAVESAIRRVINLRVKSPDIFWIEDNAEAVIYLRAQAVTGRWEEMMSDVRAHSQRTRNLAWKWESTPMSVKQKQELQLVQKKKVGRRAA
jgi:hypothetical protein